MNNFLTSLFILFFAFEFCFAQNNPPLKTLQPAIGAIPDFSDKAQQEFKRFNDLNNKENKTPQETDELDSLFKKYDPTTESLYDIIGGGDSWYNAGGPYQVKASSELAPSGGATYTAKNAQDLSLKSVWCEGKPGYGTGEYLEYYFKNESPRVNEIKIYNGYVKSDALWKKNSRVKRLKLSINGKPYAMLNLNDTRALQSFKIDPPLGRSKDGKDLVMKFEIMEAYKGDKYDDVVITEIYFNGLDVLCFPAGAQVTMADGSFKPIETIKVGDQVLSFNPGTKLFFSSEVIETASAVHHNFEKIILEDGSEVTSTPDHPFMKNNGRWASMLPEKTVADYNYADVQQIKAGDELFVKKGNDFSTTRIAKIIDADKKQISYTITKLSNGQNFIVNGLVAGAEELREGIVRK
jgi:hypothetical protein